MGKEERNKRRSEVEEGRGVGFDRGERREAGEGAGVKQKVAEAERGAGKGTEWSRGKGSDKRQVRQGKAGETRGGRGGGERRLESRREVLSRVEEGKEKSSGKLESAAEEGRQRQEAQ